MKWLILFFPIFAFASWAEDTLREMSLDEKIGQLFVAPACPLRKEDHWADWVKILEECHIGNALVKQSDPVSQVQFLNKLQNASKIPLMIVADAEWGLAMRMSNTIAFPRNMTLGAVSDLSLIYKMGAEIGRQARLVGIHLNLAPVADVNNNPANPIIHMRSFGEDPNEVALRVSAYLRGIQDGGALACAKHFPGHGDTAVDSHFDLPFIPYSKSRLEKIEFVPFQQAISDGVVAIMSAHLFVPCIDEIYPTSLSPACLQRIAREELHFQGLLISDALNMKAVADRFSVPEIALLAKRAGTDLLLYGDHKDPNNDQLLREQIPAAFKALREAYLSGALDLKDLDESVFRILQAKEKLGLHLKRDVSVDNLHQALNNKEAVQLKKRLFQEAVTLIGEPAKIVQNVAYLTIGENDVLQKKFPIFFEASTQIDSAKKIELLEKLRSFDQVVIALHRIDSKMKDFGLSKDCLELIEELSPKSVLCLFGTPYALKLFKNQKTVLLGYENDQQAQWAVFYVLTGKEEAHGKLPVTIAK